MASKSSDYEEISWTSDHLRLGVGYSVIGRELKAPALEPFKADPDLSSKTARNVTSKLYTIEDQSTLDNTIKVSVSVTAPIEGVGVEVSASYLSHLKVSETRMCMIIETTIEDPPQLANGPFKLTEEAKEYLKAKGPTSFLEKYGDYFVYGHRSHARFVATCQFSASTKETLDQFKASLSIGVKDIAKISSELEASLASAKSHISTIIEIHAIGYDNSGDASILANTKEIVTSYNKFQQHFSTVPYVALLRHYSTVDSTIAPPGAEFVEYAPELTATYQRAYMLQTRVISLPFVQAKPLADQISSVVRQLQNISVDKKDWKNQLEPVKKDLENCQNQFELWRLRLQLLGDAVKLSEPKLTPKTYPAGLRSNWARGIMIDANHPVYGLIAGDVQHTVAAQYDRQPKLGGNKRTFDMGDNNRMIVGFNIISVRTDGLNGGWSLVSGYVGETNLVVEFHSEPLRACNWSAELWTVDRLLYEKAVEG